MSLIGEGVTVRPTRHRAESSSAERIRMAAGAAVAMGALVGTVSQVAPAIAAPLTGHDAEDAATAAEPITFQGTTEVATQAKFASPVAQEVSAPAPVVEAAPVAAPVSAPFGINNLPPEISGPLSQVEDI